jgi:hypothetical protein
MTVARPFITAAATVAKPAMAAAMMTPNAATTAAKSETWMDTGATCCPCAPTGRSSSKACFHSHHQPNRTYCATSLFGCRGAEQTRAAVQRWSVAGRSVVCSLQEPAKDSTALHVEGDVAE